MIGQPDVLTVEEAAAVLRIGRTAAYDAARRGELPTIKLGRSLRVPRAVLDRMLGLETSESPVGEPDSRESTAGTGRHAPD